MFDSIQYKEELTILPIAAAYRHVFEVWYHAFSFNEFRDFVPWTSHGHVSVPIQSVNILSVQSTPEYASPKLRGLCQNRHAWQADW